MSASALHFVSGYAYIAFGFSSEFSASFGMLHSDKKEVGKFIMPDQ
jgi:hypothetical protein